MKSIGIILYDTELKFDPNKLFEMLYMRLMKNIDGDNSLHIQSYNQELKQKISQLLQLIKVIVHFLY